MKEGNLIVFLEIHTSGSFWKEAVPMLNWFLLKRSHFVDFDQTTFEIHSQNITFFHYGVWEKQL